MTESMVVTPDPSNVFEDMVLSSVFEPRSGSIEKKRQIFGKAWAESIFWLQSNFDSAGRDPRTESHGFGFLVEAFARFSERLPRKNTEKGEEASRTILSELHSGKRGRVNLTHRRSNSDFLWVELTGRRITVTGIGEVKASHRAASQKIGGQLKRQERSLEFLVEELRTIKANKSVSGFFQKKGVVVSNTLERFLIVPYGEGERIRGDDKFSGWQVIETEFSYDELVFIAQRIWPDFRFNIKIGPGKLTDLFLIAREFEREWFGSRIQNVFSDSNEFGPHNPLPCFELGLFFLATGKTPMLEEEVRWSAELVRNGFWPAVQKYLNLFVTPTLNPEVDFSERDKAMLSKFWYVLTSDKRDLEYFIYFLRFLNEQINDLVRDKYQLGQLKNMSEVWSI